MGLSVAASSAIIFVGFLFVATALFSALNVTLEGIEENFNEAQDVRAEMDRTNIHVDNVTNDTTHLFVNVTNTGSVTLKISMLQILINGTLATDLVSNSSVDGNNGTDLWMADEVLYLELDHVATGSEKVMVVTGNGIDDSEVLT